MNFGNPQGLFFTSATVDVYVHVIKQNDGSNGVTQSQIAAQMTVLNNAYAGTGFSFNLVGVDEIRNSTWASMSPAPR